MVDMMIQGLYFWVNHKIWALLFFKKVRPCSRSSRIFQHCTLIKLWRFAFAFPVYFKTSSSQRDYFSGTMIHKCPLCCCKFRAPRGTKWGQNLFQARALDMRWDATGAGCSSPVLVVVEQLEGAGKIWADGGEWQEWLLLTQWEKRSQRTDCGLPIITMHKQHYRSFRRPFVTAQRTKLICSFLTGTPFFVLCATSLTKWVGVRKMEHAAVQD